MREIDLRSIVRLSAIALIFLLESVHAEIQVIEFSSVSHLSDHIRATEQRRPYSSLGFVKCYSSDTAVLLLRSNFRNPFSKADENYSRVTADSMLIIRIGTDGQPCACAMVYSTELPDEVLKQRFLMMDTDPVLVSAEQSIIDFAWDDSTNICFTLRESTLDGSVESSYALVSHEGHWVVQSKTPPVVDFQVDVALRKAAGKGGIKYETRIRPSGAQEFFVRDAADRVAFSVAYPLSKTEEPISWCNVDWYAGVEELSMPVSLISAGLVPGTALTKINGPFGWECRHVALDPLFQESALLVDGELEPISGLGGRCFLRESDDGPVLISTVSSENSLVIRSMKRRSESPFVSIHESSVSVELGDYVDEASSSAMHLVLRRSNNLELLDVATREILSLPCDEFDTGYVRVFHVSRSGAALGYSFECQSLVGWQVVGRKLAVSELADIPLIDQEE